MKVAVILFNLGGPDKLNNVEPFLFNLFNDPAILNLPGIIRCPLAKFIANRRAPTAKKIYEEFKDRTVCCGGTLLANLSDMIKWLNLMDNLILKHPFKKRLKYLLSFGSYDYHGGSDQGFYPSFYDTLLAFVTKLFPKKFEIETLHLVNYSFSLFSIFGISKISSELFNKKIGKIVFVLSFLNPAFFGHMAINQKDMIIAFANIWTTYLIIRYLKNQEIDEKRKRANKF